MQNPNTLVASFSCRLRPRLLGIPVSLSRLALLSCWLSLAVPARAQGGLSPVKLRIGGQEVKFKVAPLSDGKETYAPLDVLKEVGAEGKVNAKGDAILVKQTATKHQEEIALARLHGTRMIALSDLARIVNGTVETEGEKGRRGEGESPITQSPNYPITQHPTPNTVYLLARVIEARVEKGALRVTTSFPVPYRVRMLRETAPARGYVDCLGASVADSFRPASLPDGEKRVLRVRVGQNTLEVARVVAELKEGAAFVASDSASNSQPTILASLRRDGEQRFALADKSPRTGIKEGGKTRVQQPRTFGNEKTEGVRRGVGSSVSGVGEKTTESVPASRHSDSQDNTSTPSGEQEKGKRKKEQGESPTTQSPNYPITQLPNTQHPTPNTPKKEPLPITVRAVRFAAEDDSRVRLDIATSGKASAFVHYVSGTTQLTIDIPNALLSLSEDAEHDQTFSHPLLSGLHIEQAQDLPPATRVTLDTTRIVGFALSAQKDRLSLELRLPRNATGALADKTIVVDAGHGGSSKGAAGRGAGYLVLEKDITLAIALKLRALLEACGARVVMTRDRDVDVALYDRPRIANDIGADLFISIHNDSTATPNSASGTTTYYHKGDPSSRALATCVQEAVRAVTGLPSRGALSDGILYASGLAVLRVSQMPAVLCEVAYINNEHDRRRLMDSYFQQKVAQAMCDGLRNYVEGVHQVATRRSSSTDDEAADRAMLPDDLDIRR